MNCEPGKESNAYPERRKRPTPMISRYTFWGGRRKTVREEDKKKHSFVDLYSTRLLVAIIFLLCLCCLDAFLTLLLIERGIAVEANPSVAYLLGHGVMPFVIIKFIFTALLITLLTFFKNFKITRFGLPLAIKIYIAVIIYELYLLSL